MKSEKIGKGRRSKKGKRKESISKKGKGKEKYEKQRRPEVIMNREAKEGEVRK
jgi:hypothetical protein